MHIEAKTYVAQWQTHEPTIRVIELGSRNTSGDRIRDLFVGTQYIGVDAVDGDDVDVVANAATWLPDDLADIVLCCELFEHTPNWRAIVQNSIKMLKPGGRAIFTCAGPERAVHGVNHDDPDQPGWYANVHWKDLAGEMIAAGYRFVEGGHVMHTSTFLGGTDTQATGLRPV